MDYKALLQELCDELETQLALIDPKFGKRSVTFISDAKPAGYWLPQMHLGTSKTLEGSQPRMAWYIEIAVDRKVIFRENWVIESPVSEEAEQAYCKVMLYKIFASGIMRSKHDQEKFRGMQSQPSDEGRIQKMASAYAMAEISDEEKAVARRAFIMGATFVKSLQREN